MEEGRLATLSGLSSYSKADTQTHAVLTNTVLHAKLQHTVRN
jgi:hypothetical protein